MTPAFALLLIGGILFEAARTRRSVIDTMLGRTPPPKSDTSGASVTAGPVSRKAGTKNFDGHPVALWIVPYLSWARKHGWSGSVTSGYRDPSVVVHPSPGLPVAPQGKSNHNKTVFPGGAVDVTQPGQLASALRHFPGPVPLRQGTAIGDPIHFSATGR